MITKMYKVYGRDGHRQRASFFASHHYDFRESTYARDIIIDILNEDRTGTNEYSLVIISGIDPGIITRELYAQICGGFFEDCGVGSIEEVI